MSNTSQQFKEAIALCKSVFMNKMIDYGSAWRILRPSSLTDQIYIKASRIRSIQEKGSSKVNEGIEPEFIGIVNYSVMALIQLERGHGESGDIEPIELEKLYDTHVTGSMSLMEDKNHDYDEAWRNMRISSLDDIILMKLLRIKSIEDNEGKTIVSEGLDANYQDMINYALFALILLSEKK
ncbi:MULTISPECIES: DUF1599 domain-containing protein [unclassified Lentimicrobium]|uniref:DUF1599 domain-containing protein n=1 Tax=unclassified Lentimicrobium TaxID=2677434 RepID=UPI0015558D17|nr:MULTISPECIES: DUF1599 domain-containing protein [unclassified Lentimicrobium]NPD44417.1 DUF1599 domain-containing protein [Lentimicrobium sp. S6]NPD84317.1 DUF1599 domain-containing protein [Lentimicrobium sp. L6]